MFLLEGLIIFHLLISEKFLGEVYDNPDDKNWSSPRPMSVQFEDIDDPGEVCSFAKMTHRHYQTQFNFYSVELYYQNFALIPDVDFGLVPLCHRARGFCVCSIYLNR